MQRAQKSKSKHISTLIGTREKDLSAVRKKSLNMRPNDFLWKVIKNHSLVGGGC